MVIEAPLTTREKLLFLKQYLSQAQYACVCELLCGDESAYFVEVINTLHHTLTTMPQDVRSHDDPIAYLHYFRGCSDWYICERPDEDDIAFGYADLFGDSGEFGSIYLPEILQLKKFPQVEIDFQWKPVPMSEVIKHRQARMFVE